MPGKIKAEKKPVGLVISVSGVRGIAGESLTVEVALRFAQAFGTYAEGGKIILARDPRKSGDFLKSACLAGLLSTGCEVIDLGVAATPTLALMTKELKARGGLAITGSHNPAQWNALKFFTPEGIYLNAQELQELVSIYNKEDFLHARWDEVKEVKQYRRANKRHISKVLKVVDKKAISKSSFRVALDSCNSAGAISALALLEELGTQACALYCEPTGILPHDPEPVAENLGDISRLVKDKGCDVGFALDADGDRVAIISEKGRPLGEEYTLALAAAHILRKRPGPVVMNMSSSRMTEEVARNLGARAFRAPVGELNVVERMKEVGAVIGGEGNGGVIYPRVHYARDGLVAIALILEYLAESGKAISELARRIPLYFILKTKMKCSTTEAGKIISFLKKKFEGEPLDLSDGLRIDWKDQWAHIRASGTEPAIRIITEAKTKKRAYSLNTQIKNWARQVLASKP